MNDWKKRRRRSIKATTTALRNKNKFMVPDEKEGDGGRNTKMQGPSEDEDIAEKGLKARREFDAGRAAIPRDKVVERPAVTKLWVNGRASEDRDERTEEVRAHCEKWYDDKT